MENISRKCKFLRKNCGNWNNSNLLCTCNEIVQKVWLPLSYSQQQNKWYPQMCLLAYLEDTLYFIRSEITCT